MDFSACVVTAVCLSISYYLFFPTKIAAAAHATASPSHLVVSLLHIRREAAADWWLHAESREPAALRGGTRREMACSGGKTRTEGREKSEMQLLVVVMAEKNSKEGNQIERGVKGSLTVQVIMEYLYRSGILQGAYHAFFMGHQQAVVGAKLLHQGRLGRRAEVQVSFLSCWCSTIGIGP